VSLLLSRVPALIGRVVKAGMSSLPGGRCT